MTSNKINGEPPTTSSTKQHISTMTNTAVDFSPLVGPNGLLIKNAAGKLVPLIVKKSVLFKTPQENSKLCVESWTQTDRKVKLRDAEVQTESADLDPNIPDLMAYILGTPKYTTGMDETTKTDILKNTEKFNQELVPTQQVVSRPAPTLKEQLFYDLRDCIGVDFLGNMPIHNAVMYNRLKDLKRQIFVLKVRKFSIDVQNNSKQTALQLAIIDNKQLDIIETLLVNGANVSFRDDLGNTLLHLAVLNTNNHLVLDLLLKHLNDVNLMNVKNDEGLTALMVAAIENKRELIQVLLENGANPNLQDNKSGRTALYHAVELNNADVVGVLLKYKADPKIRIFDGTSALDLIKEPNASAIGLTSPGSTNTEEKISKKQKRKTPEQQDKKTAKISVVSKKIKVEVVKNVQVPSTSTSGLKVTSPRKKN